MTRLRAAWRFLFSKSPYTGADSLGMADYAFDAARYTG